MSVDKDKEQESEKERDLKLSDLIKKVVNTGVGAAFMAEDVIRERMKEVSLPTDIVDGLVKTAKSTKEEFLKSAKTELNGFLDKINVTKEIERVLNKYDFEVNARISLRPKKGNEQDGPKSV